MVKGLLIKMSEACVYILHKTSHKGVSRRSFAGMAQKCTKKFAARAMFCWFLLDVLVAVIVVIAKSLYN